MPESASQQPASLQLVTHDCRIDAAAGEGGEAKTPRFDMVAYTGGPMRIGAFAYPIAVDLQGLRIPDQRRPIRFGHDAMRGVGHSERVAIEGEGADAKLVASGLISRDTHEAREVAVAAKRGFPWQASIGASVDRLEFVKAGSSTTVNGRNVNGPAYIARQSTLGEISVVDLGGDQSTSTSIAAHGAGDTTHYGAPTMDMKFKQWLEAKGFDAETITDEQKTTLEAAWKAEQDAAKQGDADPAKTEPTASAFGDTSLDDTIEAARRENERRRKINATTQQVLAERPDLTDHVGKLAKSAIEAGMTAANYELEILRLNRAPAGHVREDRSRDGRVLEASLCLAGGLQKPEDHFPEQTLDAADREFGSAGLGLGELLLMQAQANGFRGHGTRNVRGLLEAAFSGNVEAAGFSTFSLSGILSNVANKFLRQGFDAVESTWREVAAIRNVRDFKQVSSYSLTGGMKYELVGPGGELKHATAGEETYTNQADTYGRMFGVTRRDIINDDLGALTQVPSRLGRGGALKLNEVFWAEFLDNSSFFSAGNNNYEDGSTTALGIDSLTTAETTFLNQTDPDGNPLGSMPAILLVPNALDVTATNLMDSLQIVSAGGSSNRRDPANNPHRGKFRVVRSTYLSSTSLTGNSSKAWYLLANPNDIPVIEAAFLNGRQAPTVESADADFNTLGIQMRGYHDFGVNKQEFRGGVKMKGEA
ncbi:MAG: hypothetical protein GVY28_12540 [Alphaproteobacteria bacterium]|jgi:phage major head subunit gpT-like protein|nr:hypothetical protein [Alphaproteobacteria bacterium]